MLTTLEIILVIVERMRGHCAGLMVSRFAFYSDNTSSNSAKDYSFYSLKLIEK